MNKVDKEAYELAKILASVTENLLRAEVLMKENIPGRTKDWIRRSIVNRLRAIERDILFILPESDRKILTDDIMSDESALQYSHIQDLVLSLLKPQRDEVEEYLEEMVRQHNLTKQEMYGKQEVAPDRE